MRKSILWAFFVFLAMSITSGAKAQTAPAAAAAGTAKVIFHYSTPIGLKNCLDLAGIQIDNVTVHQLGKFHVWQTDLAPGAHVFSDDTHKNDGLSVNLAAGQTYYYALKFHKGFGFPTCNNFSNRISEMKPKEIAKAAALIGRPGVDETAAVAAPAAQVPGNAGVKLLIESTPGAADIEVDGNFMGNTPSAIQLSPGDHSIIVSKNGYMPWQRNIKLAAGDIRLTAELERDTSK
jgi:hypothetical protein